MRFKSNNPKDKGKIISTINLLSKSPKNDEQMEQTASQGQISNADIIKKRKTPEQPAEPERKLTFKKKKVDSDALIPNENSKQQTEIIGIQQSDINTGKMKNTSPERKGLTAPEIQILKRGEKIFKLFPRKMKIKGKLHTIVWIASENSELKTVRVNYRGVGGVLLQTSMSVKDCKRISWMLNLFRNGVTLEKYNEENDNEEIISNPEQNYFLVAEILADQPAKNGLPPLFFTRYRNESLETSQWLSESDFSKDSNIVAQYLAAKRISKQGGISYPTERIVYGARSKNYGKKLENCSKNIECELSKKELITEINMKNKLPNKRERRKNIKPGKRRNALNENDKHYERNKLKRIKNHCKTNDCIKKCLNLLLKCKPFTYREGQSLKRSSKNWNLFVYTLNNLLKLRGIEGIAIKCHIENKNGEKVGTLKESLYAYIDDLTANTWFFACKLVEKRIGHFSAISKRQFLVDNYSNIRDIINEDISEFGIFKIEGCEMKEIVEGISIDKIFSKDK